MSTVSVILYPDADGTVHLPLPEELKLVRVKVTAIVEAATDDMIEQDPAKRFPQVRPDFAALRRQIFGDDPSCVLSEEDSAFIRDRGDY